MDPSRSCLPLASSSISATLALPPALPSQPIILDQTPGFRGCQLFQVASSPRLRHRSLGGKKGDRWCGTRAFGGRGHGAEWKVRRPRDLSHVFAEVGWSGAEDHRSKSVCPRRFGAETEILCGRKSPSGASLRAHTPLPSAVAAVTHDVHPRTAWQAHASRVSLTFKMIRDPHAFQNFLRPQDHAFSTPF